jgi:hypothetical protein
MAVDGIVTERNARKDAAGVQKRAIRRAAARRRHDV